ncbi:DUF58 domain-containing protein [Mycolicibacterium flavescens]|uniref:DUF58 domain-containing protein n=1 Tax=Mycolicibacterium flavescens TaxID=1776 RepID=A0A1E3RCW4_MYCFV|nr:DUF58 domain-containing protein [Mycolicibacterium flavescens]MCV7278487.1 DUF58 domain-containing protein [Mycolicibacterium flavescens]ODQ87735.1 hypothetical protein BHQ18_21980 [Mycolicibacterium flavescens]
MGRHLTTARTYFGTDTRGMLEGGRYALLHTRSLEFDDLRPYVPGDDVRDIDWKASARSGHVLIKRYVSEKHHKVLLVADAGRKMAAATPTGERKSDVAVNILGAIGLITLGRADQIGMVFGDTRGCVNIRQRRGETHIESMLHRYYGHVRSRPGRSDIVCQLDYVATHYRHPMLIVVVSDEPEVDDRLSDSVRRLTGRHDLLWAMVTDLPAVGTTGDDRAGFDVSTGRYVLDSATLGPRVVTAYRRAEQHRVHRLAEFMTTHAVPHTRIDGSAQIRSRLVELTGVYARAG